MSWLWLVLLVVLLLVLWCCCRRVTVRWCPRITQVTQLLSQYRVPYTIEESFKFQGTTLLPDFRPMVWVTGPTVDNYHRLLALYPEIKVPIAAGLVTTIGFSPEHVYVSYRQPHNLGERYVKYSSEGTEEYLLRRKQDIKFAISHVLGDLLEDSEYDRYFVVPGKKLDYKYTTGLRYRPNIFLDQLKPYVIHSTLRHIQIQKGEVSTFYFQQLETSQRVLTSESEWRALLLSGNPLKPLTLPTTSLQEQRTRELYDSSLEQMSQVLGPGLHYHAGSTGEEDSPVVKELYQYIGTGSRVLDIGCGWGGTLSMIRRDLAPARVVGLTNSKIQADYCYEQLALHEVYHADASRVHIPGYFDCALLMESYSHIPPLERQALLQRLYEHSNCLIMRVNCNTVADNEAVFGDTMHVPTVEELKADILRTGYRLVLFKNCRDSTSLRSVESWYAKCQKVVNPSIHIRVLSAYCARVLTLNGRWSQYHPLMEVIAVKGNYIFSPYQEIPLPKGKSYTIEERAVEYLPLLREIVAANYPPNPVQIKATGLFLTFNVADLEAVCQRLGPVISIPLRKVQHLLHQGTRVIYNISLIPPALSDEEYVLKPHYDTYYTTRGQESDEAPLFNAITYLSGCNYDNGALVIFEGAEPTTVTPSPGRMCTLYGKVLHAVKSNRSYTRVTTQVALFR